MRAFSASKLNDVENKLKVTSYLQKSVKRELNSCWRIWISTACF